MSKYPALTPRLNSKIRQQALDQDYLHLLSDKEKQWLNDFMEETNAAAPGKRFYKSKKAKRKIYNENNARQRDIMSNKYATGMLDEFNRDTEFYLETECAQTKDEIENSLIDYIDSKDESDN